MTVVKKKIDILAEFVRFLDARRGVFLDSGVIL